MESNENKIAQNFESSKFTDLVYETRVRGLLEELNSPQDRVREKNKILRAMQNIQTEDLRARSRTFSEQLA